MQNLVRKPGLAGLRNPGAVLARQTTPDVSTTRSGVRSAAGSTRMSSGVRCAVVCATCCTMACLAAGGLCASTTRRRLHSLRGSAHACRTW